MDDVIGFRVDRLKKYKGIGLKSFYHIMLFKYSKNKDLQRYPDIHSNINMVF